MKFIKILGLILSLIMAFNICSYARDMSTYDYLVQQHSEILVRLQNEGLPNARINEFFNKIDNEADKMKVSEDIYTLEEYFLVILFNIVLADEEFADVCGAFDVAFQEELAYMLENEMELPELFSEFFLSVMYDRIKPEKPEDKEVYEDYIEPWEEEETENNVPEIEPVPEKLVFSDVPKDFWAYEHIISLYEKGIANGYLENIFRPSAEVTRAELAKTVCKAFLNGKHTAAIKYNDVLESDWYAEYVKICDYYSIFDGISSEKFSGDEFVTRQEMCTVIYRAYLISHKKPEYTEKYDFPDRNMLSPYAVEAVEILQASGIIEGYGDHNFYPFKITTRAQMCKVINMLLNV